MSRALRHVPGLMAIGAGLVLALWWFALPKTTLVLRGPGADGRPVGGGVSGGGGNPVLRGRVLTGPGKAMVSEGVWGRYRGNDLSGSSASAGALKREWPESGPAKAWGIDAGEGYAGAAVWRGRVFLMDYDREKKEEALRCLSLQDGQEIWRYAFPNSLKRDHGVTRTVPSVNSNFVVAIGPKCHVLAVDTATGALKWSIDLVKEHGTTVPPWYTGQNALVDNGRVILAPAGPEALLVCVEEATGKVLWRTPNPRGWKMTHSSVMPVTYGGKRMYVYCGSGGVAGISAEEGSLLWDTTDWKISIATVPCPIDLGEGRIFLTGGYNAGSMVLQLGPEEGGKFSVKPAYRIPATVFGATQHAPILHGGHLFGVRADGRFTCLSLDGRVVWTSAPEVKLGLGAFTILNDLIYALDDGGTLHLMEANPAAYKLLAKAKVLDGPEAWGPMAFAEGRLVVRDLNRVVCLEVR